MSILDGEAWPDWELIRYCLICELPVDDKRCEDTDEERKEAFSKWKQQHIA